MQIPLSENDYIFGYRVRDLILTAERLKQQNIDPEDIRRRNDDFLEGYKKAFQDIEEQTRRAFEQTFLDMEAVTREADAEAAKKAAEKWNNKQEGRNEARNQSTGTELQLDPERPKNI